MDLLALLAPPDPLLLTQVSVVMIILTFTCGMALILLEIFVPGMVIGLIGTGLLVSSIYWAFSEYSPLFGGTLVGICMVLAPIAFFWGLNRLSHKQTMEVEEGYVSTSTDLTPLIGLTGTATSPLRPSGKGEIKGQTMDLISEGPFISPGARFEVVSVNGVYLVVREVQATDA